MTPVTHKRLFYILLPAVLWTWGGDIMENDYTHATSKSEGRWRKDFTNGFHMKTATML